MTNKQYLVHEIKQTLHRDDLTNFERMRLLGLLARFVPVPVKRRKPKAVKPSPVQKPPFQRP